MALSSCFPGLDPVARVGEEWESGTHQQTDRHTREGRTSFEMMLEHGVDGGAREQHRWEKPEGPAARRAVGVHGQAVGDDAGQETRQVAQQRRQEADLRLRHREDDRDEPAEQEGTCAADFSREQEERGEKQVHQHLVRQAPEDADDGLLSRQVLDQQQAAEVRERVVVSRNDVTDF